MERYLRQTALLEIGEEGQNKLREASVLIVGAGGLGSPAATYLVSSGVGRIGIVDNDTVSESNLARQVLYTTQQKGISKVECAKERLSAQNPECIIDIYNKRLDTECAESIIKEYDIVIDGTDNADTRYLIDEITYRYQKAYIYGAICGFEGQVSVFNTMGAARYSDLYPYGTFASLPAPPPVMATTPAVIGSIEANEALKLIIGYGKPLVNRLLTIDLRDYTINIFDI